MKQQLKDQFPENFIIEIATEYAEEGSCKIRGLLGQYAIVIEWYYNEEPTTVFLAATSISGQSKTGPCEISNLKNALLSLS